MKDKNTKAEELKAKELKEDREMKKFVMTEDEVWNISYMLGVDVTKEPGLIIVENDEEKKKMWEQIKTEEQE